MRTLNELTVKLVVRFEALTNTAAEEEGSQGIEAAGAALGAAIIVGVLLGGARTVASAVQAAMAQAASILGG